MDASIVVILPCYNEAVAIAQVAKDFKTQLPNSCVFVCDNNSTDTTKAEAEKVGAIVMNETSKGICCA